jgi:hypothetical protein
LEKACGEPVVEAHTLGINLGPLQHHLNREGSIDRETQRDGQTAMKCETAAAVQLEMAALAAENERKLKEDKLVQGISEKVRII